MKKFSIGLLAVLLAIGFSAFDTMSKSTITNKKATNFTYWYPVVDGSTSSTTVAYSNTDEATIIAAQSCKDVTSVICFAGSNTTLSLGTDVTGYAANQLVKRQ